MRLGSYDCQIAANSLAAKAYGKTLVSERHRHRFDLNNDYRKRLEENGMACVGINPDTDLVEVVEIPGKRWFLGVQYHPEYSSTVLNPHPLFIDFVKAAVEYSETK